MGRHLRHRRSAVIVDLCRALQALAHVAIESVEVIAHGADLLPSSR